MKPSLVWRIRYAYYFWKRTGFSPRRSWQAAQAVDDGYEDESPCDAVEIELSYWSD